MPEPTAAPPALEERRRRAVPLTDYTDPGAPVVKLAAPMTIPAVLDRPERTIDAVTLRLAALKGGDVVDAARASQGSAQGAGSLSVALDVGFHVEIAARCSGLTVEQLRGLSAPDLLAIAQAVQAFFLDAE